MIYFITPLEVKNITTIGGNIDEKLVTPLIRVSAETWVRSTIGAFFYNDLLAKFNNSTLSTAEQTLVNDYIKPRIAWATAADVSVTTALQVKNKGPQKQNGENSQNSDFTETGFLHRNFSQRGDFYESLLIEFLKENKLDFPSFTDPRNKSKIRCETYRPGAFNKGIRFI